MQVEMGKEYTTRDGQAVRVYAVDGGGSYPVHGAILSRGGVWEPGGWCADGRWLSDAGMTNNDDDLIEAPRKFRLEGFVNINFIGSKAFIGGLYDERKIADNSALQCRVACVPITIDCREGDGLAEGKEG